VAIQVLKVKVRICDICGAEEGVCRYRVSRLEQSPRTVTVDLCAEHGAGLERVLEAKPVPRRKARAVTPIKEVKARAKPARKR
jgi:hypothetical protein